MSEVHSGHRMRMRERAETEGLAAFKPHELVELLLFYCVPRKDVNELGHAAVNAAGSVKNLLQNPDLAAHVLPPQAVEFLRAVGEAVIAYRDAWASDRPALRNYTGLNAFLDARFSEKRRKAGLWLIAADRDSRILSVTLLTEIRNWARADVMLNAIRILMLEHARSAFLVLTGDRPGGYDKAHAVRFATTLGSIGVRLLDFIGMADETVSLYLEHEYIRPESRDWDAAVAQPDQMNLSSEGFYE